MRLHAAAHSAYCLYFSADYAVPCAVSCSKRKYHLYMPEQRHRPNRVALTEGFGGQVISGTCRCTESTVINAHGGCTRVYVLSPPAFTAHITRLCDVHHHELPKFPRTCPHAQRSRPNRVHRHITLPPRPPTCRRMWASIIDKKRRKDNELTYKKKLPTFYTLHCRASPATLDTRSR